MWGKPKKSSQAPIGRKQSGGSRGELRPKPITMAPPEQRPQQPWRKSPKPRSGSREPLSLCEQMPVLESDGDEQGRCSGVLSTRPHFYMFPTSTACTCTHTCISMYMPPHTRNRTYTKIQQMRWLPVCSPASLETDRDTSTARLTRACTAWSSQP